MKPYSQAAERDSNSNWNLIAALVAAYFIIVFVLSPAGNAAPFPIHHDDYANLAATEYRFVGSRPVSYFVLQTLAKGGDWVYYGALQAFVLAYAFATLRTLMRLLEPGRTPMAVLLAITCGMLSHEHVVEYTRYTGLITNLCSGLFGMAAMALMMGRLNKAAIGGAWAFAGLSFFSKEDFVAPVLFLASYLWWRAYRERDVVVPYSALLGGLLAEAVGLVLFNRIVNSVYTQSQSGTYRADFSLVSLFNTAISYSTITRGAEAAIVIAVLALVWNWVGRKRLGWDRLLVFLAVAALMVLPYLCLPNHVYPYYGFNWTIWEIGGGLLVLWRAWPGWKSSAAIASLAAASLLATERSRYNIGIWYLYYSGVNRKVANLLLEHRSQLEPYRQVAVEGAPFFGPWFATDGSYLAKRLQLRHEWLVRVPRESEYMKTSLSLLNSHQNGPVTTVAMEDVPAPTGVPVIRLREDGSGSVDYPR
jgi:hypothetical protein